MTVTKAEQSAQQLSSDLNNLSFNRKEFCAVMTREHRYLQEEFTKLCLKWLETCASDNYRFDGRNEYSHKVSREIIDHIIEKGLY